jgi:hypothetical protein
MPVTVLVVWSIGSRQTAPPPARMPTVLAWLIVAAPVGGGALGLGQWLVLRRHLPQVRVSWQWVPATVLGWLAGLTVFPFAPLAADALLELWETVASAPPSFRFRQALPATFAVGGALVGVPLAAAQSLVLRRRLRGLGAWVWGSAAGWIVGLPAGSVLPQLPVIDRADGYTPWIGVLPGLTAATVVYGIFSALALVWLLREPISAAVPDPPAAPEGQLQGADGGGAVGAM